MKFLRWFFEEATASLHGLFLTLVILFLIIYPIVTGDLIGLLDILSYLSFIVLIIISDLIVKVKGDTNSKYAWYMGLVILWVFIILSSMELNLAYFYEEGGDYDY